MDGEADLYYPYGQSLVRNTDMPSNYSTEVLSDWSNAEKNQLVYFFLLQMVFSSLTPNCEMVFWRQDDLLSSPYLHYTLYHLI
jgi:hypothetical protein